MAPWERRVQVQLRAAAGMRVYRCSWGPRAGGYTDAVEGRGIEGGCAGAVVSRETEEGVEMQLRAVGRKEGVQVQLVVAGQRRVCRCNGELGVQVNQRGRGEMSKHPGVGRSLRGIRVGERGGIKRVVEEGKGVDQCMVWQLPCGGHKIISRAGEECEREVWDGEGMRCGGLGEKGKE